jgi:ribose 5-phosphate isomerase B
MHIAIAADHAGYSLKEVIKTHLESGGHEVRDFGTNSEDPVDYPDYVQPAAWSVVEGKNEVGIVLGGSGNGEAIAANKVPGIRCAVCWNVASARLAKEHNDANMISIGARMVSERAAVSIVHAWLEASFQCGRHLRRISKLELGRDSRAKPDIDQRPRG